MKTTDMYHSVLLDCDLYCTADSADQPWSSAEDPGRQPWRRCTQEQERPETWEELDLANGARFVLDLR